jgi:hypothetical protein
VRALVVTLALGAAAAAAAAGASEKRRHVLPAAKAGGTVVGLCDGETSLEVRALRPGETMPRAEAQRVSDQLMAEWRKKHPEASWDGAGWDKTLAQNAPAAKAARDAKSTGPTGGPPQTALNAPATAQTGIYSNYTGRDEQVWKIEIDKFVEQGHDVFHDPKRLGGTIGVSCDMCHPNAANTHPETYPKFQVQLGRVALLRDMINWCLENPVKARPMTDDDDRLRAMEAYIYAQRKGVKLDIGKH